MHSVRTVSRYFASSSGRTLARSVRRARPQLQHNCVPIGRRSYASATETIKKATGDMPWLIGAAAFTLPGVYFALQPSAAAQASHGDHEDHAAGHHEGEPKDTQGDSASAEQSEPEDKQQAGKDEESREADSDKGAKSEGGSESGENRASKVEGVNFAGGSKKLEPDAKGGTKKRIDSDLAKNIGEGASSATGDDMSNKQQGYSNTDTRHSTDPSQDSGKSKKGEGTAETAKVKGTVQNDRPQV